MALALVPATDGWRGGIPPAPHPPPGVGVRPKMAAGCRRCWRALRCRRLRAATVATTGGQPGAGSAGGRGRAAGSDGGCGAGGRPLAILVHGVGRRCTVAACCRLWCLVVVDGELAPASTRRRRTAGPGQAGAASRGGGPRRCRWPPRCRRPRAVVPPALGGQLGAVPAGGRGHAAGSDGCRADGPPLSILVQCVGRRCSAAVGCRLWRLVVADGELAPAHRCPWPGPSCQPRRWVAGTVGGHLDAVDHAPWRRPRPAGGSLLGRLAAVVRGSGPAAGGQAAAPATCHGLSANSAASPSNGKVNCTCGRCSLNCRHALGTNSVPTCIARGGRGHW